MCGACIYGSVSADFFPLERQRKRGRRGGKNQCKAYIGSTYKLAQGQWLLTGILIGVLCCPTGTKAAQPNEYDLDWTWQLVGASAMRFSDTSAGAFIMLNWLHMGSARWEYEHTGYMRHLKNFKFLQLRFIERLTARMRTQTLLCICRCEILSVLENNSRSFFFSPFPMRRHFFHYLTSLHFSLLGLSFSLIDKLYFASNMNYIYPKSRRASLRRRSSSGLGLSSSLVVCNVIQRRREVHSYHKVHSASVKGLLGSGEMKWAAANRRAAS